MEKLVDTAIHERANRRSRIEVIPIRGWVFGISLGVVMFLNEVKIDVGQEVDIDIIFRRMEGVVLKKILDRLIYHE